MSNTRVVVVVDNSSSLKVFLVRIRSKNTSTGTIEFYNSFLRVLSRCLKNSIHSKRISRVHDININNIQNRSSH